MPRRITDDADLNIDNLDVDPRDASDAAAGPDDANDEPDADDDDADEVDADSQSETDDEPADDQEPAAARGRQDDQGGRPEGRRGSRENERIRSLNEELRSEREKRTALERRFDDFASRAAQPAQVRESAEQRAQRRAILTPEERMSEDLAETQRTTAQQLQYVTYTVQDAADKSIFEQKAVHDPLYQKWLPKVEAEKQRLAQQGSNVSRDAVFAYLLGKAALESRGSKESKTRVALGKRRVERQTTRPNDTRNDAQGQRRSGGRTLEDRLTNVTL